jgi:hypothetical protein
MMYYIDVHYSLGLLYKRSQEKLADFSDRIRPNYQEEEALVDPSYVFLISCIILSFVLALKRVLKKHRKLEELKASEAEVNAEFNQLKGRGMLLRNGKQLLSCEQIGIDEYKFQS